MNQILIVPHLSRSQQKRPLSRKKRFKRSLESLINSHELNEKLIYTYFSIQTV